jgi:hypothetical protein
VACRCAASRNSPHAKDSPVTNGYTVTAKRPTRTNGSPDGVSSGATATGTSAADRSDAASCWKSGSSSTVTKWSPATQWWLPKPTGRYRTGPSTPHDASAATRSASDKSLGGLSTQAP